MAAETEKILTTLAQATQLVKKLETAIKTKGYVVESDLGTLAKKNEIAKTDLAEALAKVIDDVVAESGANKTAIETLNGEAAGSVKAKIDAAFNDFATKVSDDNVVNTYKELIDYAASSGSDITTLIGNVSALTSKLTLGKVSNEENAAEYSTVKAYVEAYVAAQLQAAAISSGNGISVSDDGVVSAKVKAENGLSVDATDGIKLGLATDETAGAMSAADKAKVDSFRIATDAEIEAALNTISLD